MKNELQDNKEKIGEAAKEYSADRFFENDGNISNVREISFEAGANWALQNQWHDASKELPEDGIKVIVLTEKGNAAINSVYTFNGNRRWHSNYAVLFWMPIPSLPKELK